MKKILLLFLSTLCLVGCTNKEEDKVNSGSELANAKTTMMEELSNYSYEVSMITKTGIMDVETTMECTEDVENKISYCSSNTLMVETEDYIDYNAKKKYSRVYTLFSQDPSNGVWTQSEYEGENTNSWLKLSDYIFNLVGEPTEGGTTYTGTISSQKLGSAMSEMDSSIDTSSIVTDDINITVFVNSSNYIEKLSYTMEILGIQSVVEINYTNFNTAGSLTIPSDVK